VPKLIAAVLGVAAGVAVLVPWSAGAAQRGEPVTIKSRVIEAGEIRAAARSRGADARNDRTIDEHVAAQARTGRLVDAKNVRSAVFDEAELSWEAGSAVQRARFNLAVSTDVRPEARGSATQGEILELDFVGGEDPTASPAAQAVGVVGAGLLGASYSGGTRLTSACQTWTVHSQQITGCYQKFKPNSDGSSTRDYYAYNRWATAVGQDAFVDWKPVVVDARSRPWAGYGGRVDGMTDYFPHSGTQLCNEGSSVNLGIGSLSLSIGLTNCGDKNPIPNATTRTMGVIYDDGFIFGGPRSKGVDFEMEVWNQQGGAAPILADYNYAKICHLTLADCWGVLGKDAGW
jgi:hypothetical protein